MIKRKLQEKQECFSTLYAVKGMLQWVNLSCNEILCHIMKYHEFYFMKFDVEFYHMSQSSKHRYRCGIHSFKFPTKCFENVTAAISRLSIVCMFKTPIIAISFH